MPPRNKTLPPISRSTPGAKPDFRNYRQDLRRDFVCSCAYCSITEVEAKGISFEIDHYLPQTHFPQLKSEYTNLLWACRECNNNKTDFFPKGKDKNNGKYVIRVDEENPSDHMSLDGFRVRHLTKTGEFNIILLLLNRQSLKTLRKLRARYAKSKEEIAHGTRHVLNSPIDRVPPLRRGLMLRARRRMEKLNTSLREELEEYVREKSCSFLLDPDPKRSKLIKTRREQLRQLGAINDTALH